MQRAFWGHKPDSDVQDKLKDAGGRSEAIGRVQLEVRKEDRQERWARVRL